MLTCTACAVTFSCFDDQKHHFKLDWHRYNLKRKVVNLGPVSEAQFNQRKAAAAGPKAEEDIDAKCCNCKKHFTKAKVLEQHKQSKKHKDAVKKAKGDEQIVYKTDTPAGAEEDDQVEELEQNLEEMVIEAKAKLSVLDCIFCSFHTEDLETNVLHMQKDHGFFIPDLEYLQDLEGFLLYVAEKVKIGHMCLYCNGKGKAFHSYQDCQKHMIAKSHCKLLYQPDEDLHEFEEFYDFSSSYDQLDGGENDNEEEDDEEWETEDEEEVNDMELVDDEEDEDEDLTDRYIEMSATGELILLDGRRIGTRQMRRYYKQRLPEEDHRPAIVAQAKERLLLAYQSSGMELSDVSALAYYQRRRNQLSGKTIKQARLQRTFAEKQRNRLDFRSHKLQHNPNRKKMICV